MFYFPSLRIARSAKKCGSVQKVKLLQLLYRFNHLIYQNLQSCNLISYDGILTPDISTFQTEKKQLEN